MLLAFFAAQAFWRCGPSGSYEECNLAGLRNDMEWSGETLGPDDVKLLRDMLDEQRRMVNAHLAEKIPKASPR